MNVVYQIKGKTISFSSGTSVRFKYTIAEAVPFENVVVIRLDVPIRETYEENIFGISNTGEIIWQVPSLPHFTANSSYVAIARSESLLSSKLFHVEQFMWWTGRMLNA
jgi:hypothetical protein